MHQGVIEEVLVFESEDLVEGYIDKWLPVNGYESKEDFENARENGLPDNEYVIHEVDGGILTKVPDVSYAETYHPPRTCPECNETYQWEDNGHDWDAIGEFKKCTDCLEKCPYCDVDHKG